jgi:hypothetical protein
MSKVLTTKQGLAKAGLAPETVVKRIIRHFNRATPEQIIDGMIWYGTAHNIVYVLSEVSQYTVDQVAAAMAQLSPRLRWHQNVEAIEALVMTGEVPRYVMGAPGRRAAKALDAAEPFDTFGKAAKKTASFARNITGDELAVTVDVWIARAVGVTESQLKMAGVYEAIAHCFRVAAKRIGKITPAQLQAVVWIVVRGSAA